MNASYSDERGAERGIAAEPPTALASTGEPERLHIEALDGLRGVAAISVMLYHAWVGNSHGWLAVDFFFCLSGFVIAMAYERKLAAGLSWWRYMGWRVMRVYPMLFVGGIIALLALRYNPEAAYLQHVATGTAAATVLAHFLLIPFVGREKMFPLNNPQWSIAYELVANAVHAALFRFLSNRILAGIITVAAVVLIERTFAIGTMNLGFDRMHLDVAIARTAFGFFTGVLCFRQRSWLLARLPRIGFWTLSAAMLFLASIPTLEALGPGLEQTRQLATALLFHPLLLALAIGSGARGRAMRWLGVLSFPLYAIHGPLIFALKAWLDPQLSGFALKAVIGGATVPIIAAALLLGLYMDLPLNRWRRRVFE